MTYSIVACELETGQLGVAVQTFNLATGTYVPFAAPGIGAVATQALVERSYGPKGLDLIREGKTAQDALAYLLELDPKHDFRQVSIVDYRGNVAIHTGKRCFPEAGYYVGDCFSTQANMMRFSGVWNAMAEAYQGAKGDLASRLLIALDAAEAAGGDLRGKQSAALLVVSDESDFPIVDLRVDHHPEPLLELKRLLRLHRAYTAERMIADLVSAGDIEKASILLDQIKDWAYDEPYLQYLRALHLAGHLDRVNVAVPILKDLINESPIWGEYLRREANIDNFGCPGLGNYLLSLLKV